MPPPEITQLAVSADGKRLATANFVGVAPDEGGPRYSSVRVWALEAGVPKLAKHYRLGQGEFDSGRTLVALSPDGKTLAALGIVGFAEGKAKEVLVFWSVESTEVVKQVELTLHALKAPGRAEFGPSFLEFTKDGKSVVFVTDLGQVQVRVKDGKGTQILPPDAPATKAVLVPGDDQILEVRRSPNAKGDWIMEVAKWKLGAGNLPEIVRLGRFVSPYAHSAVAGNGKTVAVLKSESVGGGKATSVVATYDSNTGKQLAPVVSNKEGRYFNFPAMVFSPNGDLLAVGWELAGKKSHSLAVYQASTGKRLHESVHEQKPTLLTFLPDGSALLYVRQPNTMVRMDVKSGEETEYPLR